LNYDFLDLNLPRLGLVLRICMDFVIFEHFVSELNLITALIKILHGQLFLRPGCREWFISKVDQRKKIKIDKRLIFITTDHFRGFFC